MDHSLLSPSAAHRWVLCPGSVAEEAKYPEKPSGDAAIDGTHTHTLLERCLNNTNLSPDAMVGQDMTDHEGTFTVDQERVDRVKVALAYVLGRKNGAKTMAVHAEQRVDAGKWYGRTDMAGTADITLVEQTMIEVIDYKDGMSEVSAFENRQLIQYGLGAVFPYHQEGLPLPFRSIRLTIIQPKLALKSLPVINHWDISIDQLFEFGKQANDAALLIDTGNAPLVAGESQCQWCRAKGNCAANANKALEAAQVLFEGSAGTEMAQQSADLDPNQLSDDKIREIIEAKALITGFLSGVEEEALRRFNIGQAIPGLKLVRGRGTRKYALPEEEVAKKLKRMGIPKSALYPEKLVSVAQLEKLKWANKKGDHKSLSKRQLETITTNFVKKSQGKLMVALESDSRKAITTDAKTIFETVVPEKPAIPDWMA